MLKPATRQGMLTHMIAVKASMVPQVTKLNWDKSHSFVLRLSLMTAWMRAAEKASVMRPTLYMRVNLTMIWLASSVLLG